MFSNFIQNLLNTGGQTQAMQRYAQLTSKVNNLNAADESQNPLDAIYPNNGKINSPSFEKVLQSATKSNFGTLLLDPSLKKVNADIVPSNFSKSLTGALQEATAASSAAPVKQQSSKAQILNVCLLYTSDAADEL